MRILLSVVLFSAACAGSSTFKRTGFEVHTFTHDSTQAHLVVQGPNAILFDSGYEKNAAALEQDLRDAGFDPKNLKAIVLSHGHSDHAGGARHFHQAFGTPVIIGAGDEGMFTSGKNEPICPVGAIAKLRHSGDEAATYTGSAPDVVVSDTLDLQALTGLPARVTHLPGHTKGSLVVTIGDVALAGDLLRGGIVGSGAETHFFMCDLEGNKRDIRKLLTELAPGAQLVFVGHFGPLTPEAIRDHFGP